jgi:hypothetical protein
MAESQFYRTVRYGELNPVRAHLCARVISLGPCATVELEGLTEAVFPG